MKKITYNNKQYVLNDPQYPVEETVTDADMNEIKEVVNYNANESENVKDALIHITTEKSDNLNVKDASGQNAKINVFGISKQETRSGKNKLKLTNQNHTSAGLNWEATEDEVKISGTATAVYSSSNEFECPTISAGTYKFLAGGDSSFIYRIWLYNTTNEMIKYATSGEQFTITEDIVKYRLVFDNITVGNTYNTTFKPMILEATEQDETFEQYGASPSPEFPSEIENVAGNIDITVCNKNFVGGIWINGLYNTEGILSNQNGIYRSIKVFLKKGTYKYASTVDLHIARNINLSEKTLLTILNQSFTLEKDAEISIGFRKVDSSVWNLGENLADIEFQLEKGSVATSYVEHEQQTITFPLAQNQKMYKGSETEDDGIHHKRKQIELDGTENWHVINENVFYLTLNDIKISSTALMTHFKYTQKILTNLLDNEFTTRAGAGNSIWIKKEEMTLETFKSFLAQQQTVGTPVILEYELETEEIEAYTEEQQTAYNQLQNAKTYKTVTNVFTENAELEMEYIADTKTYIDNKYNALAEQILNLAGGN